MFPFFLFFYPNIVYFVTTTVELWQLLPPSDTYPPSAPFLPPERAPRLAASTDRRDGDVGAAQRGRHWGFGRPVDKVTDAWSGVARGEPRGPLQPSPPPPFPQQNAVTQQPPTPPPPPPHPCSPPHPHPRALARRTCTWKWAPCCPDLSRLEMGQKGPRWELSSSRQFYYKDPSPPTNSPSLCLSLSLSLGRNGGGGDGF